MREGEIIGGGTDRPLDSNGLELARQRAKQLLGALQEGRLLLGRTIVTSPLQRARQTAEIFANTLDFELAEHPGLRAQHFGELEAMTAEEIKRSALARHLHSNVSPARLYTDTAPGGEAILDAVARMRQVRGDLLQGYERPLVVSHGSLLKSLILDRNDVPPERWSTIASKFKGKVIEDVHGGLRTHSVFA